MKCDACARLRHQIKRAVVKPKPTPSEAERSFGSIRTANGNRHFDFENAAKSRVFRFISSGAFMIRTRRRFGNPDRCRRNSGDWRCAYSCANWRSAISNCHRDKRVWFRSGARADQPSACVCIEQRNRCTIPRYFPTYPQSRTDWPRAEMTPPAHSPHNHRRSDDHSRRRRCFYRQNWRDRHAYRNCPMDICVHRSP